MEQNASTSGQNGATEPAVPKKLPKPHRCNDRVEDLLQSLFTLEYTAKINPAWTQLKLCLRSEVGFEPQGGHVCVKDPSLFLDPVKMTRPRPKE